MKLCDLHMLCRQPSSLNSLRESAKFGINILRPSYAVPYVDFWLIRNSTTGIPITMCHLHALKPDVFEAKDESSLRVLAWTHICKRATLSPFKALFLQRETCSPHNKGYAADCSPLIPCSLPDHLYPCADLHHTPSNGRFWGQTCHSAQSLHSASQEGSGPVWTSWEVWCQKLWTSMTLLHWVVLVKKEINSDCPYEGENSFWQMANPISVLLWFHLCWRHARQIMADDRWVCNPLTVVQLVSIHGTNSSFPNAVALVKLCEFMQDWSWAGYEHYNSPRWQISFVVRGTSNSPAATRAQTAAQAPWLHESQRRCLLCQDLNLWGR